MSRITLDQEKIFVHQDNLLLKITLLAELLGPNSILHW